MAYIIKVISTAGLKDFDALGRYYDARSWKCPFKTVSVFVANIQSYLLQVARDCKN